MFVHTFRYYILLLYLTPFYQYILFIFQYNQYVNLYYL